MSNIVVDELHGCETCKHRDKDGGIYPCNGCGLEVNRWEPFIELREVMTPNQYQQLALRTEPEDIKNSGMRNRLTQGLLGLCGEAGECADLLKKHLYQGHELDREHMAKELGDVAWYLALSADAIGCTLEYIFETNIEKLKARYPEGFDADRSLHRAEGDV